MLSPDDGIAIQDLIDQLARERAQRTDGLTAEQACPDVVADILLGRMTLDGSTTGTSRVQARIGVLVPITTLAGLALTPGISVDRQTTLDADTVRELASLPGTLFQRLLTDEAGEDLLEVSVQTYRAPKPLREAIAFRDGNCAFATCQRPASACDLDHVEPWPQGPTARQQSAVSLPAPPPPQNPRPITDARSYLEASQAVSVTPLQVNTGNW